MFLIFDCGTRKGGCRVSRWSGACRNEGKNNPADYFSDAGCTVPLWAANTKNKYRKNLKTTNYILENTPKEVIKIEMQMKNGR